MSDFTLICELKDMQTDQYIKAMEEIDIIEKIVKIEFKTIADREKVKHILTVLNADQHICIEECETADDLIQQFEKVRKDFVAAQEGFEKNSLNVDSLSSGMSDDDPVLEEIQIGREQMIRRDISSQTLLQMIYDGIVYRELLNTQVHPETLQLILNNPTVAQRIMSSDHPALEVLELESIYCDYLNATEGIGDTIKSGLKSAGNFAIMAGQKISAVFDALRHSKTIEKLTNGISESVSGWADNKKRIVAILDEVMPMLNKHGIEDESIVELRVQTLDNYKTFDMRLDALEEIGKAVETAAARGLMSADYDSLIKALKGAGFTVNKEKGKLSAFTFDWHYPRAVANIVKTSALSSMYSFGLRWRSMGPFALFPAALAGIFGLVTGSVTHIFKMKLGERGWNGQNFLESANRLHDMLKRSSYMENTVKQLKSTLPKELEKIDKADNEEQELQLVNNLQFLQRCVDVYITQLGTLGVGVGTAAKKVASNEKGPTTDLGKYDVNESDRWD